MLEQCTKYREDGVVAIDLAGDEFHSNSLSMFKEVYQEAKLRNIHRTCHASEVGSSEVARYALNELEVERIGHGYHVVTEPDLYKDCLKRNIHFECCPLSSHFTAALKLLKHDDVHPIVMFARDNANFSISKDDPTVLQNKLDDDYEYLRKLGLNEAFVVKSVSLSVVIAIKRSICQIDKFACLFYPEFKCCAFLFLAGR